MVWTDSVAEMAMAHGRVAETVPPVIEGDFRPEGFDADDQDEAEGPDLGDWIPGRLAGATFGVEYVDSKNARSIRRITALKLLYNSGDPMLRCWCHERHAYRSFRLDRIKCCYDRNGEIFRTEEFLRDGLGIYFENLVEISEPEDLFGNGMRVLAALARIDGSVHPEETEKIIQYCVSVYDLHGANIPNRAAEIIPRLVRAQRPTTAVVDRSLRGLARATPEERRLFARYACEVADADGVQHPEEFRMLARLKDELTS